MRPINTQTLMTTHYIKIFFISIIHLVIKFFLDNNNKQCTYYLPTKINQINHFNVKDFKVLAKIIRITIATIDIVKN